MLTAALALSSRIVLLLTATLAIAATAPIGPASLPLAALLAAGRISRPPTGGAFRTGTALGGVSGGAIAGTIRASAANAFPADVSNRLDAFLAVFLRQSLLTLFLSRGPVGVGFELQAAFQAPAGAGDVLRIQGEALLLGHFDIDAVES